MRTTYLNHTRTLAALALAAMAALLTGCGASGLPWPGTATDGTIPVGVPISIPSAVAGISGIVTHAATGGGVTGVQVRASTASASTNASSAYALTGMSPAPSMVVTFDVAGYVPQARTTEAYTTLSSSVLMNVPMLPVASTQTFDPTVAQTLTVPGSTAQIVLPANALQPAGGGNVTVLMTPIAASSDLGLMPGNYMGVASGGGPAAPIESFGAFDVRFTDAGGAALDLAAGQAATVRIPVSSRGSPPATTSLFYFDTATGLWMEQGTATLLGSYYEGTVSHFTTWSSSRFYPATVTYSGCVKDAVGNPVPGATVSTEGVDYSSAVSRMTDVNGNFTLPIKQGSTTTAIVQAVKDVRVSNSVTALGNSNSTNNTCLVLAGAVAVRLTWGASPLDLDSHTAVAGGNHVFYLNPGSLTVSPYVALDVDDTSGFGPEVTTIAKLAKSSTYRFYVHNYSSTFSPGQTGSPAKVELMIAGTPRVFAPPANEGTSSYWHVFDLSVDGNCNLSLTAVQQFRASEPSNPNSATTPTFCP